MQFLGFLISLAAITSTGLADSSFASSGADLDTATYDNMNPEYFGYGEELEEEQQQYISDVPKVLPQFFEEPESRDFEKFVQEYRGGDDDEDGVGDQQQFHEDGEEEEEGVYLVFEEQEDDGQFEEEEEEEGAAVEFDDANAQEDQDFENDDDDSEQEADVSFDQEDELDLSSSTPEFEADLSAEFDESANEQDRILQFQASSNTTSSSTTSPKRKGNPLLFFGIIAGVIILIALGSFMYHRVKVKRALAAEAEKEAGTSLIASTDKPLTKN